MLHVVASWQGGFAEAGVDPFFSMERSWLEGRTAKSRFNVVRVTESQFADDVALYTRFQGHPESVTKKFVEGAGDWWLTMSIEKTKLMAMGERLDEGDTAPLQVEGGEIAMVE